MKRFQIIREYNIYGKMCECMCDTPTPIGAFTICYDEEKARQRVKELHEAGYPSARYEELPWGTAWFDDNNWIG